MLMYLFRDVFSPELIRANWDHYLPLTEHNSSLSACTHSIMACQLGLKEDAYRFFITSAGADLREYRSDIEHVLVLEPRHFGALSGLGFMFEAMDEPSMALKAFEAVHALNPNRPNVNEAITRLQRMTGEAEL